MTSRRILTAWMDFFHHEIPEVTTIEFFNRLALAVRQQVNEIQDPDEQRQRLIEIREDQINVLRHGHSAIIPTDRQFNELSVPGTSRPEREPAGTMCDKYVPSTD